MEEQNNPNAVSGNGSAGPVIGIVIISAIIVLGAVYFWNERQATEEVLPNENAEEMVESINSQDESDEVSSIEADLEATEIDSLDSELNVSL
jgi:cytoskeletal protein RodZ